MDLCGQTPLRLTVREKLTTLDVPLLHLAVYVNIPAFCLGKISSPFDMQARNPLRKGDRTRFDGKCSVSGQHEPTTGSKNKPMAPRGTWRGGGLTKV